MSFEKDIERGKTGEDIAAVYLKHQHKAYHIDRVNGLHPEWDLVAHMPGKLKTIEVKTDFREIETGNIAIEFLHRNKPSAILWSLAHWYVFVLENRVLCMKKRDLFKYLRENDFKIINGGNSDMSTFWLVPSKDLEAQDYVDVWYYAVKNNKVKEANLSDFA